MKNFYRSPLAKGISLFGIIAILNVVASAADLSSETNDQLINRVQAAMAANPSIRTRGNQEFTAGIASAISQGDYMSLERLFMQLKLQLSSDPEAVAAIESLLARFQAAEEAATVKRNAEVASIVKDLIDKFNVHAPAKDFDDLLARLSDVAAKNASPFGNNRDMVGPQRIDDIRAFLAGWQEYLVASSQGNLQQAASALNQLIQLSSRFTAIPRSKLLDLQIMPGTKTEASIAMEAAESAKAKKFAEKFIAEIDAAKVPSDLDSVLAEDGPSNRNGAQAFQGYSTKAFVRKWQDYLAAVQAGNGFEAHRILQELAGNSDSTIYPRSKILERLADQATGTALKKTSLPLMDPASLTLDNLRVLVAQIAAIGDQNILFEHGEPNLRNAVDHLASAVEQTRAGDLKSGVLATQFNGFSMLTHGQVGDYSEVLTHLYEQVTIDALPGYISIPDDLKPFPQERLATYLDRVLKSAVAAKDWHLAYRVAQVRMQIGPWAGNPDTMIADFSGFRAMITAMDKEDASLWTEAVSGYLEALNSTSQLIPTKEIGARLNRIKAAHPEDFAKGETVPDYPSLMARLLEANPPTPKPRHVPGMPGFGPTIGAPQGAAPSGAVPPGTYPAPPPSSN
jgi:hypothetical protein